MNEHEKTQQEEVPPAPTSTASETLERTKEAVTKFQDIKGWSWGAFMFAPVVIIGTKNYKYLLAYLLMLIPIIGPLLILGFQVYLGLNVNTLLEGSPMFRNDDEKIGFIKGVNHAGFISFIISVVFIVIFVLFFGAMFAAIFSMFGGGGREFMDIQRGYPY